MIQQLFDTEIPPGYHPEIPNSKGVALLENCDGDSDGDADAALHQT